MRLHFDLVVFEVDAETNMDKRQELAKMLIDKESAFFSFAVVSEPEDTEEDCEDIGYAYVNVNDILNMNENYIDRELDRKFTWNDVNPLFHIVAHILKILMT